MIFKKPLLALVWLLILALPAAAAVQEVPIGDLVPDRSHRQTAFIITKVIDRYHYRDLELDDELSSQVLDDYLDSLDPNRIYFLKSDADTFEVYRDRLDESLSQARLEPAFSIFRIYRFRVEDRVAFALSVLNRELDFTRDEVYRFDREDMPWPADRGEQDDLWRKRVKNDILSLRLSGKPEDEIKETLRKRYEGIVTRARQLRADDVFQLFINAYTTRLDPHTSYMSPRSSENFDISMRLSLEGIGAVLSTENEYTEVQRLVKGGPAEQSGQVNAGDRIIGVAQKNDGEMVDVIGWRLQDVVDLIRGKKGTVVRLQVMPESAAAGGPTREVRLVRNEIKLEDQAASSEIVEGPDGIRIGVIEIPAFYRDFKARSEGDENYRSTTRDVRLLLEALTREGVDGIVVDLRHNGGGSLSEATELTGLFIQEGPVVQVRDSSGKLELERDPDPEVVYGGPLAVLVDRHSASASEIFAGAIQDYGRGLVLGEPTFGKGTVQTLIDLDRFVRSDDDLGRLRLTMAQFYRVNGESTQFRGVVPDILFPFAASSDEQGERGLDNALPWDHIKPADFSGYRLGALPDVDQRHRQRIREDAGFRYLIREYQLAKEIREQKTISLNEATRRAEWERREKARRDNENAFRKVVGLKLLPENPDPEADDEEDEEADEAMSAIQAEEAARILSDYIRFSRPLSAMAR